MDEQKQCKYQRGTERCARSAIKGQPYCMRHDSAGNRRGRVAYGMSHRKKFGQASR